MASQNASRGRFGQQTAATGNPLTQQSSPEQAAGRGRQTPEQTRGNPGRSRDEIARKAYEIWQSEGCPEGRSLQHWLRAEQAIGGQGSTRDSEQSSRPSESQGKWRPESSDGQHEQVIGGRASGI